MNSETAVEDSCTVTNDCPNPDCRTRNASMTVHYDAVTGLRCSECGKMWAKPQLEVVQSTVSETFYDSYPQ